VERFRSRGGPYILLPIGLCEGPDRPGPLDLAGCRPYSARKLERRMDLGSTEHSLELGTHPHCTPLCAIPFATGRPEAVVGFLQFISRHTLEIYAIQLAGSELLIKLVPQLAG
jgi:hypothetical protein